MFFGTFDFLAADAAIVLIVDTQKYIIRMLAAVLFTVLFMVFLGVLLLIAVLRKYKTSK